MFRTKNRPDITALDELSLSIDEGEVHGLLGPNGAGKTTLVRILSTVLLPSGGRASVLGHDVVQETREVRRLIGIVFGGERGLYPRLTGRQNLRYWAALYRLPPKHGVRVADELLDRVGLLDRANDRVETYSRGMRQRLRLARGLIGDPRVIFFDEPSSGMDPVAALEFRTIVGELAAEGRTILLATHDMAEAEAVCQRVSLIDRGRILATGSPASLGLDSTPFARIECENVPEPALNALRSLHGVDSVDPKPAGLTIIDVAHDATGQALQMLVSAGVVSIRVSRPTLEDVYLRLVGRRGLDP